MSEARTPEALAFEYSNKGDLPALKELLSEHRVTADNTGPCGSPNTLFWAACQGEQPEALAFLFSHFPNQSLGSDIIGSALDKGSVRLVTEICKYYPAAANDTWQHNNVLGYACNVTKNPEIVKVLLDAGADPNKGPEHLGFPDIDQVIISSLPASTMEQFFDAGYNQGARLHGLVSRAVHERQPETVKALYARGKDLPEANLPAPKELMEMAERTKDKDMIALVKSMFPEDFPSRSGFAARLFGRSG